jgi:hypothetical protein
MNEADLQAIRKRVEADLLRLPGVTGVDVGPKRVNGENTGKLAIRVYVARKRPLEEIPVNEQIPSVIGGVPTDVVERAFTLHAS